MKKRVLIICERFAPENTVGAIRMTKVAKYLKLNYRCQITVLLREREQFSNCGDARYVDHFIYATESRLCRYIISLYKKYSSSEHYDDRNRSEHQQIISKSTSKNLLRSIKVYLKSFFAVAYSEYTPRSYCRNAWKRLKRNGLYFDVVISSFGPAASHYVGKKIKKEKPEITWIADYRDPLAIGETTKGFLHNWALSFADRITGGADYITVASKGFVKCLNLKEDNQRVHIIHNGYDKDDYNRILRSNTPHEKMRLVYTGTLFSGSRDISIIFRALHDLIEEGKIVENNIEIIYAGQDKKEFLYQFNLSHLKVSIDAKDIIPKNEALRLQGSADLLMLAAWNTEQYQGSLPLKVYEYLYVGKPIVCSIYGTASGSELKEIIDSCNAGICYEAANHETDYPILKKALYEFYIQFCEKGYVECLATEENKYRIDTFDYRNIAKDFYFLVDKKKEM